MGVPVYEISKDFMFSAAHQIRFHPGKCERLHGHNWRIRLHARASRLNHLSMVVDFADLQRIVADIGSRFDHRNVNEIPPFDEVNTTAENIARFFYDEANRKLAETEGSGSGCRRSRSGRTRGRWRCTGRSNSAGYEAGGAMAANGRLPRLTFFSCSPVHLGEPAPAAAAASLSRIAFASMSQGRSASAFTQRRRNSSFRSRAIGRSPRPS